MPTANESIRDQLIRHQVNLQRLGAGLTQEALAILDKTEAALVREIEAALNDGADVDTSAALRKMQTLEDVVTQIRADAMDEVASNVADSAVDLVRHEAEFTASLLDVNSPVQLDLTIPAAATLAALVSGDPFEGKVLSDWFQGVADDDAARIMDGVKVGLTRGLSIDDIVRSVVGTTTADGADGITNIARNNISSLIRTAVNAYSNKARSLTTEANADVVGFEVYTAVLDARTTFICASLDGTVYPVGEGRFPPQHFNCRSVRVPTLNGELAGTRPMKPTTEKMLVAEFADINGVDAITRDDLARGLKGEFDKYAQQRTRELIGQVAAKTTYQDWLKGQSAAFQDEVLGVAKGKLFRDGGLSLDKYVHRDGTELTLDQLAKTQTAAFRRAGIDPSTYAAE